MNPLGKTRKEEYNPEEARRMAARVAQRSNPLLSKKKAEKIAAKVEKKQRRGKGIGF
jgi:hypothetical protein